ncbi:MFS transporter [Paenibacillus sp. BSR1-1]|uniref:MFS transporter n=1 Tax=Paenibacillus sp. BSR1-1 TaxID=3020845 RepID=UPI0025AF7FDB|nr:MFS transporter [Paenibacillus sp. BSR1-1]MDN3020082.1 MFS transporter [Paenibacillus sp. BSR1-1]
MKKKFFYGWIVVFACTVLTALGTGVVSSLAVFLSPMVKAKGYSIAGVSSLISLYFIGTIVGNILLAKLLSKANLKIAVLTAGIIQGILIIAMSKIDSLSILTFITFLIGFIIISVSVLPVPIIITNWFKAKRGTAMGIAMAGVGLGAAIFAPSLNLVISSSGYKSAFVVWGVAVIILAVICGTLIYTRPEDKNLKAYGLNEGDPEVPAEKSLEVQPNSSDGISLGQSFKTSAFWLVIVFVIGTSIPQMIDVVQTPSYLTDIGVSNVQLSQILFAFGICSMLGKMTIGYLFDKFGLSKGCMAGFTLGAITLVSLVLLGKSLGLVYLYILFGGAGLNFNFVALPIFTSKFFGTKHYATIYSGLYAFFMFLSSILGTVSGVLVEKFGYSSSYLIGFIFLVVAIFACISLLKVKKPWLEANKNEIIHTARNIN